MSIQNWASWWLKMVKCLPSMRETRVWSLGWEDPLEKEMTIHSSILNWQIPWTEEPGRLQSMGSQRVRHNWMTSLSLSVDAGLVELLSLPCILTARASQGDPGICLVTEPPGDPSTHPGWQELLCESGLDAAFWIHVLQGLCPCLSSDFLA